MPAQLLLILVWIAIPLVSLPVALVAITATRRRLQPVAPEQISAAATASRARAA